MNFPLIDVKNVNFSYGSQPALVDINLVIEEGDFLAIIGPNGSGKTTLIKIMVGLLKPQSGKVKLFGQPVDAFKRRNLIGYVPQHATNIDRLFPVSVGEVVEMALLANEKSFPKSGHKSAVNKALDLVEMNEFVNYPLNRLSGGQQQRVFIARALVTDPKILILDEPTTGVDARTHENFYDLLASFNKSKKLTIILVTHEIGVINRNITKVACLNQRLIFHGQHDEFCSSSFFREFLERGDHVIFHQH